ncbi:sulfite exporter TauE/SafE family protein 3-like [Alnus glutinosa]|uniref:sulfite exporter TauE/SafE family protein 3-like n=1 Tax=Alnus glutinosa TaxID=3517 RepID=UPI002D77C592|nr:sulfite exporter TauE/SafE family protein 3-like [Alnus glutinosa]
MAGIGSEWLDSRLIQMVVIGLLLIAPVFVSAKESLEQEASNYNVKVLNISLWQPGRLGYQHVWPAMEFGWKIVVGTIIGFFGAAFGSVGGVGGGGIFVPMLTLIIGFDEKSSTAISKCMIMGGAAATVFYNLRQRHPTLDLPIIDYDLALLFQPMLMLGISIGVAFNVIFADWMITVFLIVIFLVTSTKAFLKGVETWKKETITKEEAARYLQSTGSDVEEVIYKPLNGIHSETKESEKRKVYILENIYWKEVGLLFAVWIIILALQISKNYTTTCSVAYWVLNLLQIPVTFAVTSYEAVNLYKGRRAIASKREDGTNWRVHQLVLYCACGIFAGLVGGLLGLGGGFILGPLFLELGVPPQVSSATASFAMAFSSTMSVVEYYLLKRFPVPYALYFVPVAAIAALVGQHLVRKVIAILGRASLIIFILASTIFISAISTGGVGIVKIIENIQQKEYMGFDDICTYET